MTEAKAVHITRLIAIPAPRKAETHKFEPNPYWSIGPHAAASPMFSVRVVHFRIQNALSHLPCPDGYRPEVV